MAGFEGDAASGKIHDFHIARIKMDGQYNTLIVH